MKEDYYHIKISLNFSTKRIGLRAEPNLGKEDIISKLPKDLTRRMVLSQVNGFFDPARIIMRHLWIGEMKSARWDAPIPPGMRQEWRILCDGSNDGSFRCTLIASKCKVTPLKVISMVQKYV